MNNLNLLVESFRLGTWGNRNGVIVPFSLLNGELIGATSDLIVLPRNYRIDDAKIWITTASNASVTANIGIKGLNGTSQDVVNNLFAVQSLAAVAFARKSATSAPIELLDDHYLRLTVAGANLSQACAGQIQILGEYLGPK